MNVDILEYNRQIENKGLLIYESDNIIQFCKSKSPLTNRQLKKTYIQENNLFNIWQYILDYCKIDVMATMELFFKIQHSIKNIIKTMSTKSGITMPFENFASYRSAPQMSGYFYELISRKNDLLKMKIINDDFGRFIYSSYFGGRVDFGIIGEYRAQKDPLIYIDGNYTLLLIAFS